MEFVKIGKSYLKHLRIKKKAKYLFKYKQVK